MSEPKKRSRVPALLALAAAASAVAYVASFRSPEAGSESARPVSAPAAPARPEPKEEPLPPIPVKAPEPAGVAKPAPEGPVAEVDALLAEGQWREARGRIGSVFAAGTLADAERTELARRGFSVNQRILRDEPDGKEVELYEIRPGDTIEGIARKFKTLSGVKGAILLVNGYKETTALRVGRKVRIPRGTWSVVVDKSLFTLWICHEGAPFKGYVVAIGTDRKTPAARFVAGAKNPKPAWWPPAESGVKGPVPYGDPKNPLGAWWIALDHDLHHGIGIHGTNEPGTIGQKASNGCVRMLDAEVSELAAISFKGMEVVIVE